MVVGDFEVGCSDGANVLFVGAIVGILVGRLAFVVNTDGAILGLDDSVVTGDLVGEEVGSDVVGAELCTGVVGCNDGVMDGEADGVADALGICVELSEVGPGVGDRDDG